MVQVLPFPLNRRVDLIRKQAEFYAGQGQRGAENSLTYQLDVQRQALLRKGVDPKVADDEVHALEGAIRAHVWRLVLTPGRG